MSGSVTPIIEQTVMRWVPPNKNIVQLFADKVRHISDIFPNNPTYSRIVSLIYYIDLGSVFQPEITVRKEVDVDYDSEGEHESEEGSDDEETYVYIYY